MMILILILVAVLYAVGYVAISRWRSRRTAAACGGGDLDKTRQQQETRRLGYRYADDLVFVQGTSIYTAVQMAQVSDEFATESAAMDIAMLPVSAYTTLLSLFDNEHVYCQELIRYRPVTTEGWVTQLLDNSWNPTRMFKTLIRKVAEHIKRSTPQRMWCLVVRLGSFPRGDEINPLGSIESSVTGVTQERIDLQLLARYHAQANQVHDALSLWAEPLSRQDLIWLIRKPLFGSIPVPEELDRPTRAWRGGFFEMVGVLRASNPGWHVALHQRDADTDLPKTCYTATLVVTDDRPRAIFNKRNAWGPKLARLGFPVEITCHYELIPADLNTKEIAAAVDNVFDEADDRAKAGADEDPRFEARFAEGVRFRSENLDDPKPGMIGRLRLTVSAATPQALVQQVNAVKSAMQPIKVDRPESGQLLLLEEQLPGGEGFSALGALSAGPAGGLDLWSRRSDLYAPAIGMLSASTRIGDRVSSERGMNLGWIGPLIGWVKANGRAVHFDPIAQLDRLQGAGIAIVGASGGGKSSLALLLFFWASESGVRCMVADPKVDFRNFVLYIAFGNQVLEPGFMAEADAGTLGTSDSRFQPVNQQFWADTDIVDLMVGPRGLTDPWALTDTFDEGYNLAVEIIDVIFGNGVHRSIAKRALRRLHAAHKMDPTLKVGLADILPSLQAERDEHRADLTAAREQGNPVVQLRAELDQIEEVIGRLEHGMTAPLIRLVLGTGTDPTRPKLGTKRRTIFTMAGYRGPENPEQPDTWTDSDRNAAVAMRMLLRLMRSTMTDRMVANPVTGQPGRAPSLKIIDEGYMYVGDPAGRNSVLVDLRQGRSYGSALVFIDQQPGGIAAIEQAGKKTDPETNQFAVSFGFKQRSSTEAKQLLQLMRGTVEDLTHQELTTMQSKLMGADQGGELGAGECAVSDVDGSMGVAVIDHLFDVVQRASQTNHAKAAEAWAHEVPASPQDWEINPEALTRVRTSVIRAEQAGVGVDQPATRHDDIDLVKVALTPDADDEELTWT